MKKNFILLFLAIFFLTGCSGFLNEKFGYSSNADETTNPDITLETITAEIINVTTDDNNIYHIVTWGTNPSVTKYKIIGELSSAVPNSISTTVANNLASTYTSYFDSSKSDTAYSKMYYQIQGYNVYNELVAQSEILSGTKEFTDTIEYNYVYGADYPHKFTWADAMNVKFYTITSTNANNSTIGTTWSDPSDFSENPVINWKFGSSPTKAAIKICFYLNGTIYSEAKTFTLGY